MSIKVKAVQSFEVAFNFIANSLNNQLGANALDVYDRNNEEKNRASISWFQDKLPEVIESSFRALDLAQNHVLPRESFPAFVRMITDNYEREVLQDQVKLIYTDFDVYPLW